MLRTVSKIIIKLPYQVGFDDLWRKGFTDLIKLYASKLSEGNLEELISKDKNPRRCWWWKCEKIVFLRNFKAKSIREIVKLQQCFIEKAIWCDRKWKGVWRSRGKLKQLFFHTWRIIFVFILVNYFLIVLHIL